MMFFRVTPRARVRKLLLFPRLVLMAANNAAIGGQAVMEGVMMRGPSNWAIAIRRHTGEIVEIHRPHIGFASKHRWARLPIVRGVVALGESLAIGFRALSVSAHYAAEGIEAAESVKADAKLAQQDELASDGGTGFAKVIPMRTELGSATVSSSAILEADKPLVDAPPVAIDGQIVTTEPDDNPDANPDTLKGWQIAIAFIMAFGFTILLFKVLPVFLTNVAGVSSKSGGFVLVESSIRISIFIGYLALVGLMPDMKRVFQFHSAEHRSINAWEHGIELTPSLVNQQSRIHVRCGTAFMLWVFVVAIFVFGLFNYLVHPNLWQIVVSRVALLPIVAGISFELIRFAGKHPDNKILRGILAPGLWMQYLTTRECDEEHCEVAIASLQVVLRHEYPDASETEALDALSGDDDAAMQVMA
ncbi:MAG: DUF1385 domain-containing protein [Thermoleophilia bacterium]|nr:DUF1385 domain-containing protein [Thermoleophilia bacterium]